MLDVYKITSVLEKLPDAALQQYASMHKQDPYVLSLAVEESNRRKRIRSAPQGQEQGQPPPVNEQAVQGMAPEDTGIAQLPAGNMDFANGGIVAFADAGSVDASGVNPTGVDTARARRIAAERALQSYGLRQRKADPAGFAAAQQEYESAMQAERGAMSQYQGQLQEQAPGIFGPITEPLTRSTSVRMPSGPPGTEEPMGPPAGLAGLAASQQPPAPPGAAPPAPPTAPPDAPPGSAGIGGGARIGTSLRTPTPVSFDPAKSLQDAMGRFSFADPAAPDIEAARADQERRLTEAQSEYKAALPQGKAYERREAALKKEEEGTTAKKDENLKMALINAGLGMMAGTSQFAAVNIGEGAKQGVKSYSEGKEKLEQAAEKRQELFDKIEEARRAEQRGDAEKGLQLRKELAQSDAQFRALKIQGVRDMFKVSADMAKATVDAQTALERQKMQAEAALRAASVSASSQAQSNAKTAMMEYGRSVRMRYQELEKSRRDPMTKLSPGAAELLDKQMESLMGEITNVERQLATIGGLTPPAAAQPAPGAGNRMRFDAKGNPIQ
jgi:hypothetical protein